MLGLGQTLAKSANMIWLAIKDKWSGLNVNFNSVNANWEDL